MIPTRAVQFYLTYILAFYILTVYLAYILTFFLAVEVRQCPLRSGTGSCGPAVPTAIKSCQLRSGGAYWDRELARREKEEEEEETSLIKSNINGLVEWKIYRKP